MSEAWIGLGAALITGLLSLWGVYASNRKSTALMEYRMDQLERNIKELKDKQDKHNGWVERLIKVEGRVTEAEHDIRDLKGKTA